MRHQSKVFLARNFRSKGLFPLRRRRNIHTSSTENSGKTIRRSGSKISAREQSSAKKLRFTDPQLWGSWRNDWTVNTSQVIELLRKAGVGTDSSSDVPYLHQKFKVTPGFSGFGLDSRKKSENPLST